MNCKLCQNEFDAYREGKLPPVVRLEVEAHLRTCETCAGSYRLFSLAEAVIGHEKEVQSNPFLATRIMAGLDEIETAGLRKEPAFRRALKPAIVTFAIAAAIAFGIFIGRIYQPVQYRNSVPMELALIDDAALESIDILSLD